MRHLLLGCGTLKNKRIFLAGETPEWDGELITLDMEPSHKPDVVWDLNQRPLPFEDNSFDRLHMYEIAEHLGHQGDWKEFFLEFGEYWRILKPDGLLLGTCPAWDSMGAWGDPSHTRVLSPMTFTFLDQDAYVEVGKTVMSDFRAHWKGSFKPQFYDMSGGTFSFILKAVKNV